MDSFLKKIREKLRSFVPTFVVVSILAVISALPLLYSWGKINLGFDTFLPFMPENSYGLTYQWTDRSNGIYTLNLYFVWVFFLHTMQKIGLDIYRAASALQFCIFFFSGLGIYKTFNLFAKKHRYMGLIPATFFIYSPFMLDFMLYQFGIIGIVWSIYFFLKFIVLKRLSFLDAVFTSMSFATIIDLPNPKYHFMIFVSLILILVLGSLLRLIKWGDIKRNITYFVSVLALSAYLLVPFLIFGYSFAFFNDSPIATKKDYALTGETIDYGVATVQKMVRLFHTPNLTAGGQKIIEEPFFFFSYYLMPILILGVFPFILLRKNSQEKKLYILLYLLALFFIFLSKGANPPFGILYEIVLIPQLLSFLRTTAGFVVYAAIFYAIILGLIYQHAISMNRSKVATTVVFAFLIFNWGFHIWSGQMFFNHSERFFDTSQYGILIPKDYFQVAKTIANKPLDAKVDVYPAMEGYTSNSWGYFGIVYYPWLMKQPTINFEKSSIEGRIKSAVNAGYILHDKTAETHEAARFTLPSFPKLYSSPLLDLYEVPEQHFIPHIYVPDSTMVTDKIPLSYLAKDAQRPTLIAYFSLANSPATLLTIPEKIENKPQLEYVKVNPSKYRVRVHEASGKFPLVFLENFHALWKLYLNQDDQRGMSDLPTQNYVSSNLHNTIQNDNLPAGSFFETLLMREVKDDHLKVNRYFNAWLLDPAIICLKNTGCKRNPNGTFDFEVVIEFLPQRAANISLFISISTLVGYGTWRLFRHLTKHF